MRASVLTETVRPPQAAKQRRSKALGHKATPLQVNDYHSITLLAALSYSGVLSQSRRLPRKYLAARCICKM